MLSPYTKQSTHNCIIHTTEFGRSHLSNHSLSPYNWSIMPPYHVPVTNMHLISRYSSLTSCVREAANAVAPWALILLLLQQGKENYWVCFLQDLLLSLVYNIPHSLVRSPYALLVLVCLLITMNLHYWVDSILMNVSVLLTLCRKAATRNSRWPGGCNNGTYSRRMYCNLLRQER